MLHNVPSTLDASVQGVSYVTRIIATVNRFADTSHGIFHDASRNLVVDFGFQNSDPRKI